MTDFKHLSVRDLAWAIRSPPLIAGVSHHCAWPDYHWYRRMYEDARSWLLTVDADPSELDELLDAQKDRRLGKYFETLWYFWLSHSPDYEVVEKNVQIIIEGETLGEIDFILFDKTTNKTLHWEVAVKFYLGVDDTRVMHNWHGPNLRDRLDIKVAHLMQRQSVIGEDQRVAHWLKQRGIHIDQCAVILKGRLYFPWSLARCGDVIDTVLPSECARELSYGYWLKQSEFDQAFDGKPQFEPLINKGWLERIPTEMANKSYSKMDRCKTVSNKIMRLPLHVQVYNPCCTKDRVFLVDENWPLKNS